MQIKDAPKPSGASFQKSILRSVLLLALFIVTIGTFFQCRAEDVAQGYAGAGRAVLPHDFIFLRKQRDGTLSQRFPIPFFDFLAGVDFTKATLFSIQTRKALRSSSILFGTTT